jgi:hypothetical protein
MNVELPSKWCGRDLVGDTYIAVSESGVWDDTGYYLPYHALINGLTLYRGSEPLIAHLNNGVLIGVHKFDYYLGLEESNV